MGNNPGGAAPKMGPCSDGMLCLDVVYDILCAISMEAADDRTRERASEALGYVEETRSHLAAAEEAARERAGVPQLKQGGAGTVVSLADWRARPTALPVPEDP